MTSCIVQEILTAASPSHLNICVVITLIPTTGVTLPFVSYGGNAIMMFLFASGVLLNISRQKPEPGGELL